MQRSARRTSTTSWQGRIPARSPPQYARQFVLVESYRPELFDGLLFELLPYNFEVDAIFTQTPGPDAGNPMPG